MNTLELRHFRYVEAVAEAGSFTRAAARLDMAQPPLSQQIARLELLVGHPLFTRRPRVTLTEAGVAFLRSARDSLAHAGRAIEAARRAAAAQRVVIRLGFASTAALGGMPGVVRRFERQTPGLAVELIEMHSAEQLGALEAGRIDIGITREPGAPTSVVLRELTREHLVALIPRDHRLAGVRRLATVALADEPFILFPREVAPALYDQIAGVCREAGFTPRHAHSSREWATAARLVGAGLGITIGPASIAATQVPGVVVRRLSPAIARSVLYLARPREATAAGPVALWDFLIAQTPRRFR